MLNNKTIGIILIVSVLLIITVYGFLAKATTVTTVSGYLVLMDQQLPTDTCWLEDKFFDSIIYLPSDTAEGQVTSCSFNFPTGIKERADITKDGRIDATDIYLFAEAYGCEQGQDCWNKTFNHEDCYFVNGCRLFKDPNRDCKIDDSDLKIVSDCWGNSTDPISSACENDKCCKADINKDGKVNLMDYSLLAYNYNKTASIYQNYRGLSYKDADINGDGKINLQDYFTAALNYGYIADRWTCTNSPLKHLSGNQYEVTASGWNLGFVGVAYMK